MKGMMISVQHKVLETKIDGKREIYLSDKLKNQTSNRTLPLLLQAEQLLLDKKNEIEKNKILLGKNYDNRYLDYVCVDNLGRLIPPNRLTKNFIKILRRNNLRKIRFHNLRHSCASIMLSNGVPMKQIQEWLGHADFSTTANIYSHLDYSTKLNSANTMTSVFSFSQTQENKKRNDKTYKLEQEIERLKNIIAEKEDEEYLKWKKQIKKRKKDFEM